MFLQSLFFAGSSPVRNGERDAAGKWGGGWERQSARSRNAYAKGGAREGWKVISESLSSTT